MILAGKKVVVTGATRGIGNSIAIAFRSAGAYVVGTGTSLGADSVTSACHDYLQADFSSPEDIESLAERIARICPDVLVNNAGINKISPFVDIDPGDFLKIQRVNLFAPFRLCQAVLPGMLEKRWGRIVNITSIWGKISREFRASYSASKFGLDGMTLALSAEHSRNGVLANCVAPGVIETQMTRTVLTEAQVSELVSKIPEARMGRAEEVAELVVWLGSPANTYVTGQNISIDGGFVRA